jgi:ferredoxin-type protein NapF
MKHLLKYSRYLFLILALILAMPFTGFFTGGLLWFSPYLLLTTALASKTVVLLNLIGLASLVLIFLKRRIICLYACPLGVVCDQVSRLPARKRKLPLLKNFHKGLALFTLAFALFGLPVFVVLDPFYIFQTSFEPVRTGLSVASTLQLIPLAGIILVNLIFPGSWCSSLCPLGGLQVLASDLKNRTVRIRTARIRTVRNFTRQNTRGRTRTEPANTNRRHFISGLAGLLIGTFATSLFGKGRKKVQIRPPSALPERDFFLNCIRCGNCISACPTDILYQQTDTDLPGFLAPAVDFSQSYCLPDCKRCGDVCPSGAIQKFALEEKKNLVMATVRVDFENCRLFNQKECDQCRLSCEYDAISFQVLDPYLTPMPVIDTEKCVGCAACKIVCPENVIRIVLVPVRYSACGRYQSAPEGTKEDGVLLKILSSGKQGARH